MANFNIQGEEEIEVCSGHMIDAADNNLGIALFHLVPPSNGGSIAVEFCGNCESPVMVTWSGGRLCAQVPKMLCILYLLVGVGPEKGVF